jgi:hypothetical protein
VVEKSPLTAAFLKTMKTKESKMTQERKMMDSIGVKL